LSWALNTDRRSHNFTNPEVGGKVDKVNLAEVGCSLKQMGIEHIAAYSPLSHPLLLAAWKHVNEFLKRTTWLKKATDCADV
jgi:hypothetical protein